MRPPPLSATEKKNWADSVTPVPVKPGLAQTPAPLAARMYLVQCRMELVLVPRTWAPRLRPGPRACVP